MSDGAITVSQQRLEAILDLMDLVVSFARDITAITRLRGQTAEQRAVIDQYHGRMAQILEQQRSGREFLKAGLCSLCCKR